MINYCDLYDILELSKTKNEPPFILILDGIEDPHNFGAILRSAEAAGVHGVVIRKARQVQVTETVIKVSTGAAELVPIAKVSNINDAVLKLKDKRVWVFGLEGSAEMEYTKADFKLSLALVIGSEGDGISHLVKRNCDFLVKIPMKGKITSLNASVSAGIAMYEVLRQRAS